MKAAKITTLILFSTIWIVGLADYYTVYPYLYKWGVIDDEYQYGDFYNLAHLPQFKEKLTRCPSERLANSPANRPVHFYAVGDSFLEPQRVDSADFAVNRYQYIKWGDFLHVNLDTNALNIVLFESIERHLRQHVDHDLGVTIIPDTATYVERKTEKRWMQRIDHLLQSDRAEGQLGVLLLAGNRVGLQLKEWRASLTHRLFGRVENSVVMSDDGKHLVYHLDTDTLNFAHTSGYSFLPDSRIDSLVAAVNQTRSHLLEMGFDHMLFSIIPNKSTIVMPDYGHYNHMIERIQSHPNLQAPFVSVIDEYRKLGARAYLLSDSHWTCEGRAVWLTKVNRLLGQLAGGEVTEAEIMQDCKGPASKTSLMNHSL